MVQSIDINDKRDSLMQSSVFSGNDTNDLQLQNLWVDRTKKQVEGNESIVTAVLFTGAVIAIIVITIKILF